MQTIDEGYISSDLIPLLFKEKENVSIVVRHDSGPATFGIIAGEGNLLASHFHCLSGEGRILVVVHKPRLELGVEFRLSEDAQVTIAICALLKKLGFDFSIQNGEILRVKKQGLTEVEKFVRKVVVEKMIPGCIESIVVTPGKLNVRECVHPNISVEYCVRAGLQSFRITIGPTEKQGLYEDYYEPLLENIQSKMQQEPFDYAFIRSISDQTWKRLSHMPKEPPFNYESKDV